MPYIISCYKYSTFICLELLIAYGKLYELCNIMNWIAASLPKLYNPCENGLCAAIFIESTRHGLRAYIART